nr:reverse transcriptase domain-containing protein [Tanacetum cinerariifolium]
MVIRASTETDQWLRLILKEDPPKDPPEVLMADNLTMAELLQAPTEGYEDAIVIPEIAANNFELKHGLINLVQNKQFFRHDKEDPHAHIRYIKITSTMRVPNVPSSSIKLMLFSFSLERSARIWLENEPPRSILTWDDLVTKFINQFFPPSKRTNLRNEITRFQQRFDASFYEAWDLVAKVSASSSTPAISSEVSKLKDLVRALLLDKKNQSSAPAQSSTPAPVKTIEPNCVTCDGAHSYQNCNATSGNVYRDNIQEYVSQAAAANYNQGNNGTEVTKDQVQTPSSQSTAPVQPSVIQSKTQTLVSEPVVAPDSVLMPNLKSSIPYPSRRDNERHRDQANEQIEKFYEIFKDMSFEISFTDALIFMPKFASTLKDLIGNKEKLIDFVVVDFKPDPRIPLILRRGFLKTGRALIDVHKEVVDFSDVTATGNPTPYDDPIVSTTSPTLTPFGDSDFLLFEEADAFLGLEDDPNSPKINPFYYDPEGDILLLEAILNSEPLPPLPNHEQYMPSFKKELKVCEAKTVKSSIDKPPEVELKDLPPHLEYAFLEGGDVEFLVYLI